MSTSKDGLSAPCVLLIVRVKESKNEAQRGNLTLVNLI